MSVKEDWKTKAMRLQSRHVRNRNRLALRHAADGCHRNLSDGRHSDLHLLWHGTVGIVGLATGHAAATTQQGQAA